jgi:hypothetical protein
MARQEQFRGLAASGLRGADQFLIGSFGCCDHQNHCNRFPAGTRGAARAPVFQRAPGFAFGGFTLRYG